MSLNCFVHYIAYARFTLTVWCLGVYQLFRMLYNMCQILWCGQRSSSASSTTTNVGLAHTCPITMVHTDMQSWIHNVFHDIFYQQEHFGPRKQWQRTSYSVCKILCVSVVVYVVSDHEQTDILWDWYKESVIWKYESNNMTKICIHIHVCMLAEISSCSARLVASW